MACLSSLSQLSSPCWTATIIFSQGLSDLDVSSFCARCVDPMGEESDHVQLVALTDALQVRGSACLTEVQRAQRGMGAHNGDATACHTKGMCACGHRIFPQCWPPARAAPCPQVPVRVVYLDRSLAPGGGGDGDGNGEVRGALSLVGVAWCGTVGRQAACNTRDAEAPAQFLWLEAMHGVVTKQCTHPPSSPSHPSPSPPGACRLPRLHPRGLPRPRQAARAPALPARPLCEGGRRGAAEGG